MLVSDQLDITTDAGWLAICKQRHEAQQLGHNMWVEVAPERDATQKQLSSMELWCSQLAEAMQDGGLDMREVIKVPIAPSAWLVREKIWKPMLKAMFGRDSTRHQTTKECIAIHNFLSRELSQRIGITPPPWPSELTRGQE